MENQNSRGYLEDTKQRLFELLRQLEPIPGTQIHTGQPGTTQVPTATGAEDGEEYKEQDPDVRETQADRDARVADPREHYGEGDQDSNDTVQPTPMVMG
jgi:hypothetical protein